MWKMGRYAQNIQFSLSSEDQYQMSSWLWFTFGNGFCFASVDINFQQLYQLHMQYIVTDLLYSIRYVWWHKRPRLIIINLYCNSAKILRYSVCQHHAWRNFKIIFLSKRKIYIFCFNRILKYYEMDRLDVVHTKLIIPTAKTLFLLDLGTERLRYHCYPYSELVWIWGTNSSWFNKLKCFLHGLCKN